MLHPDTSTKGNVTGAIQNATDAFTQNNAAVQNAMAAAYPDPVERETARQRIVANLNQAQQGISQQPENPSWFVSRNAMAGVAQSAMNVRAQQPAPAAVVADAPIEKYGPLDPEWIECLVDGFKTLFDGKAPFVQHAALTDFLYPMKEQIKIALVGDWGADNNVAQRVAAQIKASQPDIVIHLGDIYYAGQENEAEATLKIWPMADATGAVPPGTSFALNGNHEMFCGGRAYFGTVFQKFGQEASYFGLRNGSWQILAFDSAYVEDRLLSATDAPAIDARLASQWEWLVDKMKTSPLPTILLSHHQPVSAFASDHAEGANLRQDFQKFLAAAGRSPFGWFFGHEHRCTFYDSTVVPFARLIGHGCIPHAAPPANQQSDPNCEPFTKMNFRTNANGDAVSGFALLSFNGEMIDIRYIDEDGFQFAEEVWEAPPQAQQGAENT
jgi:Calcineurin-like phosphoesterase